jgi:thymidylate synthase (FAD)
MISAESDSRMKVELLAITPGAERLIEEAGRTAYMSFAKRGEGSDRKFIRMLLKNRHYSVLEHASATFRISGVSRALTHQLVRHRLCSFTQQSQRYVNEKDFQFVEPEKVRENPEAHAMFLAQMESARKAYAGLQAMGVRNEDARFVLPNAVESQLVVSANLRQWRHIIELRCRAPSQWEIRQVSGEILKLLKKSVPTAFSDLELDEKGTIAVAMGDD